MPVISIQNNAPPAGLTGYPALVMAKSPLVYYRLDETSGAPLDSSGNGKDATLYTLTPTYAVDGLLAHDTNKAMGMPGGGCFYITDGSATAGLGTNWSVGLSFKRTGAGPSIQRLAFFFHWPGPAQIDLRLQSGVLTVFQQDASYGNETLSGGGTLSVGDTHHAVLVSNGSELRLYLDGTLIATGSAVDFGSRALTLNAFGGWGGNDFLGTLDEAFVLPTGLSPAEVTALYAATQ